jgi:ArsR family transcriptional regulator, arsenate/arsenite/antimonite-responsive transcriptional repressor
METLVDVVECTVWECGGTPLVAEPVDTARADALARVFKALSDPVRVRLLSLIGSRAGGEACVCELTGEFDVSNPTISHHLKVLREAGLVTSERRASWVFYRVVPETLDGLSRLLNTATITSAAAVGAGAGR